MKLFNLHGNFAYISIYTNLIRIIYVYTHTTPNLAAASLLEFDCKTFSKVLEPHYKSYERTNFERT